MNGFRALAAEFQKVLTTRTWWILAIILVVYVGAVSGGLAAFFGWTANDPDIAAQGGAVPPGTNLSPLIYSFASSIGYVFPVLLGALATTGEFRHQTLTPTFLANPHRAVVLWAKFAALVLIGAFYGVLAFAASVGAGAAALSASGLDTGLESSDTWALIGRGILAMALWAGIGVGLGALVPSQVASIVIVIAFTQFVEPILRTVAMLSDITRDIGKFLPGAASDALVGASFYSVMGGSGDGATLEWWAGGLVLLGIAVVITKLGYFTSWRRDVT